MVENVFRLIKNQTYKRLYNSIEILAKDIGEILNGYLISSSLKRLFSQTVKEYLKFIERFNDYNLN